jgi:hypothetical protein
MLCRRRVGAWVRDRGGAKGELVLALCPLCFSARAVEAIVFLKRLLREPVEGERRHGAIQVRSSHAPLAVGAAPPAKVVTFDPDQAFIHTSTFAYRRWDRNRAATGGLRKTKGERGDERLPVAQVLSHGIRS